VPSMKIYRLKCNLFMIERYASVTSEHQALELRQNVLHMTISHIDWIGKSLRHFLQDAILTIKYRVLQLKLRVRYVMMPFVPRWSNRRTLLHQESPRHKPLFGSTGVIVVRVKQCHSGQHHQQARTSDDNAEQPIWSGFRQRAPIRRQSVCRCETGGRLLRQPRW